MARYRAWVRAWSLACTAAALVAAAGYGAPAPVRRPALPRGEPVSGPAYPLEERVKDLYRIYDGPKAQARDYFWLMGDAIRPQLADLRKTTDNPKVQNTLDALLEELDAHKDLGPTLVTLKVEDARPEEAMRQLLEQVGLSLPPQEAVWAKKNQKITWQVQKVPFWAAMQALCEWQKLRIQWKDGALTFAPADRAGSGQNKGMAFGPCYVQVQDAKVDGEQVRAQVAMICEPRFPLMGLCSAVEAVEVRSCIGGPSDLGRAVRTMPGGAEDPVTWAPQPQGRPTAGIATLLSPRISMMYLRRGVTVHGLANCVVRTAAEPIELAGPDWKEASRDFKAGYTVRLGRQDNAFVARFEKTTAEDAWWEEFVRYLPALRADMSDQKGAASTPKPPQVHADGKAVAVTLAFDPPPGAAAKLRLEAPTAWRVMVVPVQTPVVTDTVNAPRWGNVPPPGAPKAPGPPIKDP